MCYLLTANQRDNWTTTSLFNPFGIKLYKCLYTLYFLASMKKEQAFWNFFYKKRTGLPDGNPDTFLIVSFGRTYNQESTVD